jgi:exodeoxyribonuclease V
MTSFDPENPIAGALIRSMAFAPTEGQQGALSRLANFLSKSGSGDTYLLKGYAGTGKTTIIAALVKALPKFRMKVVLLAPTGRAAKVMAQYSGKQAFTIHRKIYRHRMNDGAWLSWALAPNMHRDTLFIVDEASMIYDRSSQGDFFQTEQNLLQDLIRYVASGNQCRLLLVGDKAQLPPVGQAESPALDISLLSRYYRLRAGHFELTEVVRQEKQSGILLNATALRKVIDAGEKDFQFRETDDLIRIDAIDLPELLATSYSQSGVDDTIVICRSNRSANQYNRQIRYAGLFREEEISAGDLIMCVKNNYFWLGEEAESGFIANGDILKINRVSGFTESHGFRFVDLTVEMADYPAQPPFEVKAILDCLYTESPALTREQSERLFKSVSGDYPDNLSKTAKMAAVAADPLYQALQIKFAYALTCHKAQGGQWKRVIIDQGYLTEDMVDKNYLRWLYTAVTRATEKVYLVNFADRFFE